MARTRVFEVDQAIEVATDLFWRNGYERTSLADLTEAMGITPPSFYFAFGSKEGLFKKVLEYYARTRLSYAEDAVNQPTARDVAEQTLFRMADLFTDPKHPRGCLAVNCSLAGSAGTPELQRVFADAREGRRRRLRERFKKARAAGDLPADSDPDDLARFLLVVGWGLAIAAQSGATRNELRRTVATALKVWPS